VSRLTSDHPPNVQFVTDAQIVDSSTGKVFAFYGKLSGAAGVLQSDVMLSTYVSPTLGTGTGHHLHEGAFDNIYLTGNGSTGSLYICGSSTNSTPTIQRIGFTNSGRVPASPFTNPIGTMNEGRQRPQNWTTTRLHPPARRVHT
jgi:hypothetical protein